MSRRNPSLHVRNIPDGTRHEDIRRLFGKYGHIYDVTIPLDYYSGRMKGFAFVEFEEAEDAEDACYKLDKTRFMGREIEVEFTRGTRKTPSDMRGKDRIRRFDDRRGGGSRRRSRSFRGGKSRSRSRSISPNRRGRRSFSRSPSRSPRRGSRSPNGAAYHRSRSRS